MDAPGLCPRFPLAGEDARRVTLRDSCLLLRPLPSLEHVPGQHPPPLPLSPVVWGCKSLFRMVTRQQQHLSSTACHLRPPHPFRLPHGPTHDHGHSLAGPRMQPSHGGTPQVPHAQRGPFCPRPGTVGAGQNTAALSVPAGPAPAWPGVNRLAVACPPPVPPRGGRALSRTLGVCAGRWG